MNGISELRKVHCFPESAPSVDPSDHGWFQPENQEVLSRAISPATRVIVELGSWVGLSTRFMAQRCPLAMVIAVDHWAGSAEHYAREEWRSFIPTLYETFLKSCWALRDRIIPLRMDTCAGLRTLSAHQIHPDVIYIDASHDYESVTRDFETCLDLFPEAMIVGDDFLLEDVQKAVSHLARKRGLRIGHKAHCWWQSCPAIDGIKGADYIL